VQKDYSVGDIFFYICKYALWLTVIIKAHYKWFLNFFVVLNGLKSNPGCQDRIPASYHSTTFIVAWNYFISTSKLSKHAEFSIFIRFQMPLWMSICSLSFDAKKKIISVLDRVSPCLEFFVLDFLIFVYELKYLS